MEHQEDIVFHLTENTDEGETSLENGAACSESIYRALLKIIDESKVEDTVNGKYIVQEEDLEVKDLNITEEEFTQLKAFGMKYFSKDAFRSLESNYDVCLKHEGYIFPAYTDTEDPYWLFYYPSKLSALGDVREDSTISGYWLDQMGDSLTYKLLFSKEETSMKAMSIVKCDANDPASYLFLRREIPLKHNAVVTIPQEFHISVISCLKTQGFV